MRYIWIREWRCQEEGWNKIVSAMGTPLFATVCVLLFSQAEEGGQFFLSLPVEVRALLGFSREWKETWLVTCLLWLYMPFCFFRIGGVCRDLSASMLEEEREGRIFFVLNRHCSRFGFAVGKLAYYGFEMAAGLFGYLFTAGLLVLPGMKQGAGRLLAEMGRMWVGAVFTGAFWMLTSFLYVVTVRGERYRGRVWRWMGILLATGNLWRVRDLLVLLLHRLNLQYSSFYRLTGWLKGLRRLSPLWFVNPFTEASGGIFFWYLGICLVLCAGLFGLGLLGFRLRNITLEGSQAGCSLERPTA